MNDSSYAAPPAVDTLCRRSLAIGGAALVVLLGGTAIIGVSSDGFSAGLERAFFSYLIGFVFWAGVALGSLAIAMLHQMTGGNWGVVIRRLLESSARTLPLLAVLFLPLVFGLTALYEWARPEAVAQSHILEHKHPYLNVPFFLARTAFYFAIWIGLAYFFTRWSRDQDETGDPKIQRKLQLLSGPGIVLYALTVTFASVDWVMSLDPEWFSTIFGFIFMGGQGLSALAFVIAILVLLSPYPPLAGVLKAGHLHDLGKLMLAFVLLWSYFNFSQFLIIWAGNLPEEIPWFIRRLSGGWAWAGLCLVVFHFALPFVLLLSRDLKRNSGKLISVSILVILARFVDTVWLVAPEFHGTGVAKGLGIVMDFVALIGFGGIWCWYFLLQLKSRPVLPLHDPNWKEAETS